ncbi:hypothetical protein [Pseudoflavonifractor sp. 524-17]|uniref:hypothetical protein n=1 Tax=Pseudoflavonifractor sp. 524-17 TaxID=2304577 RepID=UPI001FAB547F|nr:hypothetical protein [Pseudoflavonifractor sp. 524-17]
MLDEAFHEIGAPVWDEVDYALAKGFTDSLTDSEKAAGRAMILERYGRGQLEEKLERPLDTIVGEYLPDQVTNVFGATDVGDVSFVVPTAKLNVAANALGTQFHSWQMAAQMKIPHWPQGNAHRRKSDGSGNGPRDGGWGHSGPGPRGVYGEKRRCLQLPSARGCRAPQSNLSRTLSGGSIC